MRAGMSPSSSARKGISRRKKRVWLSKKAIFPCTSAPPASATETAAVLATTAVYLSFE
jgi:hypothetical protein